MVRIQYFSLQRLNGRIFWAFVGLASLMLATGIGSNFLVSTAENSNQQHLVRLRQVSDIQTLQAYVNEQRNSINLITLYKVSNVLPFISVNSIIRTHLILEETSHDFPTEDAAYTSFQDVLNRYTNLYTFVNDNLGHSSQSQAEEQAVYSRIKTDLDNLAPLITNLLGDRQRAADDARRNYLGVLDNTRWTYLVVSVILFGLALLFALVIARLIAVPLSILVNYLRQIAVGDLTKQMNPTGADELVELSLIFNRTVVNLKQVIARIQDQARNITSTSGQIITSSDEQANTMLDHSQAITQTSVTITQLADSSQQIAGSASLVAESANLALASANQCYDTMLGTNDTMNEIRLKVNMIATSNLELNAMAQRIREITLLIDNFSNETHLLALNAAIEAAGAGEEGARFGVVAGHVRKLAQRSRIAAVEIQQLVSRIQGAAARSVMVTEEGIKVVALGEQMLGESLQANANIIQQIGQTTQLAEAISQATDQQGEATGRVADTILQLSTISQTISQNSQYYRASAGELGEVVTQLNAIVTAFIIQEEATEVPIPLGNEPEQSSPRLVLSPGPL